MPPFLHFEAASASLAPLLAAQGNALPRGPFLGSQPVEKGDCLGANFRIRWEKWLEATCLSPFSTGCHASPLVSGFFRQRQYTGNLLIGMKYKMRTRYRWMFIVTSLVVAFGSLGDQPSVAGVVYQAVDWTPQGCSTADLWSTNGVQFAGSGFMVGIGGHALLWNGAKDNPVDLNPSGFNSSMVKDMSATGQIGLAFKTNEYFAHAMYWSGTAASAIELTPSGFYYSYGEGICGTQQVGYAMKADQTGMHAFLWNGTAASATDLNPSGCTTSSASGTNGTQQVGVGYGTLTNYRDHALLWSGSAANVVDLNPSAFYASQGLGICGSQQVGRGYLTASDPNTHALLWSGSAASAVDLNPGGISLSEAEDTNGAEQIGFGRGLSTGNNDHAYAWFGTADSAVDLHQYLGSGFVRSYAKDIDAAGNIVGYAVDTSGSTHAVLWQVVPEPSTIVLLGIGAIGLVSCIWRRRRKLCALGPMILVATVVLAAGVAQADVFNMGGTRDQITGTWTGSASLEFVTVGDPGNAADTLKMYDGTTGYGSVPYVYQMGKYDVTVGQYCQFLNAVAKTDTYGLYSNSMATALSTIKITRSGASGSYSYLVTGSHAQGANCPIFNVSWGDAARFCNWLQNGQPAFPAGTAGEVAGSTETGAYTLNGDTTTFSETRNSSATYVIPSVDELYKAAYYKGGSADAGYWLYSTKSNAAPVNILSSSGTNNANFYDYEHTGNGGNTDSTNDLTPVGAFAASPGPYGTFDMGGDVWQWTEATAIASQRGFRGGSWDGCGYPHYPCSLAYGWSYPTLEDTSLGFRVAYVPEPSTFVLLGISVLGLLSCIWRRRRKLHALGPMIVAMVVLAAGVAQADVFNMGGTRDPATGVWTGQASLEFVTVGDPGNAGEQSRLANGDTTSTARSLTPTRWASMT